MRALRLVKMTMQRRKRLRLLSSLSEVDLWFRCLHQELLVRMLQMDWKEEQQKRTTTIETTTIETRAELS